MTTLGQVDATLARFNRKSPRDAYKQVCEELELHYQRVIYNKLPDTPSAWHRVTVLELDHTLLGPKGCKTLLPCILVSTALRKLSLKSTGLTDEFVVAVCDIFQSHPTIRSLNISENPLVSVFSASSIISLIRRNSNMVEFDVSKTHVGDNVANIIQRFCDRNLRLIATYFEDKYFKLKTTFDYLDADGLGWVPLKSLVMNCPYPILQEQFIERIAKIKPKKRSDNKISINTFLSLVYMNFKTELEIAQYAKNNIDEPYVFLVANWKQILSAADRYNEDNEGKVTMPQDLHRLRIKDLLLTNEEADKIIQTAVSIHASSETGENNCTESNMWKSFGGSSCVALSSSSLNRSARECIVYSESIRPVYQFYEERDVLKVSDVLMNGSRLLNMSALLGASGTSACGGNSRKSSAAGTVVDLDGPKHTWQLASSVVAMIVDFFYKTFAKLPEKKESSTAELTAKERRDLAMEKKAIPVTSLFECSFETDFEIIRPHLLANYYSRFSIPTESAMITLQEVIIVMNELYTEISVDKNISLEEIHDMENPFEVPDYTNFLANHLLEREEEDQEIEFPPI